MNINNIEALIAYMSEKESKFMFFWGHRKVADKVTKSCFSQWFESSFSHEGIQYKTAEHFMMAEKAKLFDPESDVFSKIIEAKDPGKAKKLGRQIKHFDEQIWLEQRFDIVVKGNYLKFSQNPELKQFLLNTSYRVIVEASPVDPIWGIGMAADHRDAANPKRWKGLNLLGFALMQVRDQLEKASY